MNDGKGAVGTPRGLAALATPPAEPCRLALNFLFLSAGEFTAELLTFADEFFVHLPHWSWALMGLVVLGARRLSLADSSNGSSDRRKPDLHFACHQDGSADHH